MTKQAQLTRICTACGVEKPLTAFLYLTSKLGTAYGGICASCRGKGIREEAPKPVVEDEKSPATAGLRMGVKELAEIEQQQKQDREALQEKLDIERKKRDQLTHDKMESGELQEKTERFLRESLQGFMNYQSKKNPFLSEKKDQRFPGVPAQDERQRAVEAGQKTEATRQDERKNSVDLSGAEVRDEANYTFAREATVKRMESMLGGDAAIMKNRAAHFYRTLDAKKTNAPAGESKPSESPREFIERTWGPSSRRR